MKNNMKRILSLASVSFILLVTLLPFFSAVSFAEGEYSDFTTWKPDRSGKIHQVVDGREHTDQQTKFSLSYDVQGGRDFKFHYDTGWAKWEGKVNAAPGEVITVSYTATYPTLLDRYGAEIVAKDYSGEYHVAEYIHYFNNEEVDGSYLTYLRDERKSNSSAASISGSFSLTVPRLEDLENLSEYGESSKEVTMSVDSWIEEIYQNDPSTKSYYDLSFDIDVIIDEDGEGIIYDGETIIADTEKGETEVSIPAAIVIGAATAAGAAVAGAAVGGAAGGAASSAAGGAAGGTSPDGNGKKEEEKETSSFKMIVGKDFGDGIRRGAKPVKIWARMAEVKGGRETARPDLNGGITMTAQNASIQSLVNTGANVEASVSVDASCNADQAVVTFIYNGKGGTFRTNVVFKIVGEPKYEFREDEDTEKAQGYSAGPYPYAVIGDGHTYKMRFTIADTTGYPDEISVRSLSPDIEGKAERDPSAEYGYILSLTNKTSDNSVKDIFVKEMLREAEIVSVFPDGTRLTGNAGLKLYPEGLSIRADKTENGERIPIKAYDNDIKNDSSDKLLGEKFYLILAVKTETGAEIILPPEKAKAEFSKQLQGDTRLNNPENETIAKKYTFRVDPDGQGSYYFIPYDTLHQKSADELIGVTLSATVEYKGSEYMCNIPFRLIAKKPDPMADWKTEYARLQRIIEKFSMPEEKDKWLECLKNCATEPPVSVQELRMVSKEILRIYMKYWTTQNKEDFALVARYDNILYALDWAKFIGDCAFSYLMNVCAGPLADAIITPAKDIFVNALGEYMASAGRGEKFDYNNLEISKALNTAGDNVAANMAVDGIKANPKKWFYYIAGYYVVAVFRNYCYKLESKGESDLYGAFADAFKDMTVNMFKAIASELFGKWLSSPSFQKQIGDKLSKFLMGSVKAKVPEIDVNINLKNVTITTSVEEVTAKTVDAVTKYLTELIGAGWGRICDKAAASQFGTNEAGQAVFTFPLWEPVTGKPLYCELVLSKCILYNLNPASPFMYLFDMFFSTLTGAPAAISFPDDPPIARAEERSR